MRHNKARIIIRFVRNFLFSSTNKEFLIFLFFLCLSAIFWLMMTLNETFEKDINVPVRLVNVPHNVIITSDLPSHVRVTMRDKGYVILAYLHLAETKGVTVDFHTYANSETGHSIVPTSDLLKQIAAMFNSSTRLTSIRPDNLDFFYNYGTRKRVPVRLNGHITPEKMYYLARVSFWPDSVTVFASDDILNNIDAVYTDNIVYTDLSDTVFIHSKIRGIRGAKIEPSSVKIGLYPDIYTEGSIMVPITGINMPDGKILRTFPSKVEVKFITGVNVYKLIRPENFTVVADYNDIAANPSDKCHIRLHVQPKGLKNVQLGQESVDYLIEQE